MIAPTIIIGLGGIGSDICCRVSRLVKDGEQRKRLRFVCIDTDVNDLERRRAEDPRIVAIQTSAPYVVGNYLETNTRARENWFPNHKILMGKTPTEGAGQVRAISRLAFDEAVREGRMNALNKAIEDLYYLDGAAAPQAIRVMIVSTLAGGTGSGIVLPVALYIRNFLTTRFRKNASVVRGFFLLPELMFGNKSPEECGSLCCNAYASMRELDAFMRRGDGALDTPRYRGLKLELPDTSSGNYVDYMVSPFNFCFLYDKRNTDDLQLKSFDDYKEHAANTIYAQTISGMSNRSNSNEDNTIKALVRSNGRNRFCGAGSSLLKYPRDSVLEYIAGQWCMQAIGDEWLRVDRQYARELADNKLRRKKNPSLKDQPRNEFYMEKISGGEKNSFEEQIYRMVTPQIEDKTGQLKDRARLEDYTVALDEYIKERLQADKDMQKKGKTLDGKMQDLQPGATPTGEDGKGKQTPDMVRADLENAGELAAAYINAAQAAGRKLGRTLAMQMFQDERDYTGDKQPYRIETFMRDEDGRFIHPNAARYFIYALLQKFTEGLAGAEDQIIKIKETMDLFDDPATPEVEDVSDAIIKQRLVRKFIVPYIDKKALNDIVSNLDAQRNSALEYAMNITKKAVYETGVVYLREMASAYETFFDNLEKYLRDTRIRVADIEHKYVNGEGKATRYICASETCLHGLFEQMPGISESSAVNGELSASIYHEMKKYALMAKKPNASKYFEDLYKDTILGFWSRQVENTYAATIDMDVITALEAEAEFESGETMDQKSKEAYAAQVLRQAERLAAPFIEEPMGEIRHPFTICAFNPDIMGAAESTRLAFVRKYLMDEMGGQPDDNVSRYELMAYKAIYDLSAGDLKRFRAPRGDDEIGGEYYVSYMDVIRQLGPNTGKNKVLTPHIDKNWHLVKYMPDLDDYNQSILEDETDRALAWGMLSGLIEQRPRTSEVDGTNGIYYRPSTGKLDTFIVSNGTICNELYEVADALGINPPQVGLILQDLSRTIEREVQSNTALGQTKLARMLNWENKAEAFGQDLGAAVPGADDLRTFNIRQFAPDQKASMFDMIYWIKASTPADIYDEEDSVRLVGSMFRMIEDYTAKFVEPDRVYLRCYKILLDQFRLFLRNLADDSVSTVKGRINDSCVNMVRDQIAARVEEVYNLESQAAIDAIKYTYDKAIEEYAAKAAAAK